MTRIEFLFVLLVSIQMTLADDKWVWNSNSEKKNNEQFEFNSVNSKNSDSAIQTIDNIIIMGRSGRKIPGFDSLYDDPDTYQALTSDNETFARSAIAQKVCSLKLTNCDDNVARHYGFGYNSASYNNLQQVIVAQPVALKPVGRPIQAIPISANVHPGPQPIPYSGKNPIGGYPFVGQPIHKPLLPNLVGSIGVNRPLIHAPLPPPHHRPNHLSYGNTVQGTQHIHHHYHHSDISSSSNHFDPISKPVYEGQDFIGSGYYKDQQFLDCDCVPLYQCDDDFKRRSLNQQHLAIDPRAPNVDVSVEELNQTNSENESSRRKRETEYSNEEDEKSRSISEKKFSEPIKRSCQNGYVCCPNRNARKLISQPQCGVKNIVPITGRVKNEEPYSGDSDFGEYPWQVAILKSENNDGQVYVSGGVLISDRHVLTSAHNLYESKARTENLILRLGEYDVRSEEEQYRHIDTRAEKVVVHPNFNKVTLHNDIALITLTDRVNFGQNIHITPACMPSKYTDYTGQRCWTTGWGKDDQKNGHYQNILKEVDLPIVDSSTCQSLLQRERLGSHFNLHAGFICAGGEPGKDACKGDGGSPLVCESKDGSMEVVGLVSWGLDCGRATVPGVYTKVSHYLDWIKSNIQKERYSI